MHNKTLIWNNYNVLSTSVDFGNLPVVDILDMLDQRESRPTQLAIGTWVFLYFIANLALTVHNKWVLSRLNFRFPWILTTIHISVSGLGSWLMCRCNKKIEDKKLDRGAWIKLLSFSILYALNIAMSNVSLAHVSLSFHQIVRSSVPVFILVLEAAWLSRRHSTGRKLSLIPLIFGVTLATTEEFKDVNFTMVGLLLTLAGVVLAALKGVATNVLMVGPLKMHPLQVISHMALPAAIQCFAYGVIAGELKSINALFSKLHYEAVTVEQSGGPLSYPVLAMVSKLAVNGGLAFVLNWVSFTANKQTSALTMTVVANVKQVVSISLAIYIFNTALTVPKLIGIGLTIIGATWYRY